MQKIVLASVVFGGLLALSAFSSPVQAGSKCEMKCCHEFSVDAKLEKMTKKLNLTSEQQASIRTILEEKKTKMEGLKEQMKSSGEETQEKIKAVLTDEQKTKYEEMKKDNMGKKDKKKDKKK
jgi:periplasmic protein CpxP/Spy